VYSLTLRCKCDEAETLSLQLWECGTVAVSESEEDQACVLIAGFEHDTNRGLLLRRFSGYSPEWHEDRTDWEAMTREAWPGRLVGRHLYLAPPWSKDETPGGRRRVIHNPGQASGTGEHPCTQLALEALEKVVFAGCRVLDVGTGSGILAIAAMKLGAGTAVGVDQDEASLQTAKENHHLNAFVPLLVAGSADCIEKGWSDITVANISGTVLLSIADELMRVSARGGVLILTGFPRSEAEVVKQLLPPSQATHAGDWTCVTATLSSSPSCE
jgi:ribosomal protein L11 methyltransferase